MGSHFKNQRKFEDEISENINKQGRNKRDICPPPPAPVLKPLG